MKFTIAYTLLFLYVISAIVFWGYSLHKQNDIVTNLELEVLNLKHLEPNSANYYSEVKKIDDKKHRRVKQYWGEGTTFLFVIMLAAGIVYFSYYRQLQLSKLQKNFMLSVTHELKTPIAGIKLNMQTLEKRKLDEETQTKLIKSSVQETNRLNDLCNNILIATQLEDNKKAIFSEEINIHQLIEEQITEICNRNPKTTIQFESELPDFHIKGDTTLWKLVISNLLENARKYSPNDKPIHVRFEQNNSKPKLSVADLGIGISDNEKKRIFEKFYRIGNENTRNTKGTGLGLFIVKKIVTMYKYDITVRNNTPNGSIFEVLFS
jgi:K+-sensing histidine kinase KdpD